VVGDCMSGGLYWGQRQASLLASASDTGDHTLEKSTDCRSLDNDIYRFLSITLQMLVTLTIFLNFEIIGWVGSL
jgi:hypothetical protein